MKNMMLRKGIQILIWMLLLVVPMTAQDSIPMATAPMATEVVESETLATEVVATETLATEELESETMANNP